MPIDYKLLADTSARLKARQRILVTIPGSGFHPQDRGSWASKGLPNPVDHVVFFHTKHDALFVGDDATRVHDALQDLYLRRKSDFDGQPVSDERKAVFLFEDVSFDNGLNGPKLTVHLSQWNDLVPALLLCGIGVAGASLDGTSVPN